MYPHDPEPTPPLFPTAAPALGYARPTTPVGPPAPRPLPAVLMTLPGLVCWMTLLALVGPRWFRVRTPIYWRFDDFLPYVLLCWPIAVIVAIASLCSYLGRGRKPWYVWINLLVNIPGLLFTAGIVILILVVIGR